MAVISVATLKTYFQTGDFPTESNFVDLIDTLAALPASSASSTSSAITNDVTTNATMFPTWVTANTGNLPIKVSSTLTTFNPSTKQYTFGTTTTSETACDVFGAGCSTYTYSAHFEDTKNGRAFYKFTNNSTGTSAFTHLMVGNVAFSEVIAIQAIPQVAVLGVLAGQGFLSTGSGLVNGLGIFSDNGVISLGTVPDSGSGMNGLVVGANPNQYIGIGTRSPSASLHIAKAGTATAPPFKIITQATTFLATPQAGAIEYGTVGFVLQNDGIVIGGTTLISQEKFSIQASTNASLFTNLRTTSNGTTAFGFHRVTNDGGKVVDFGVPGSGYTTAGGFIASYGIMFTSGTGFNIIASDASSTINFYTGGSAAGNKFLVLNSTGQLYGTALHNNSGAVTGTTNQYVASGTYTPTITNGVNVAASTAFACQWIRVGNVVTISGRMDIDPTTTATLTLLEFTLPIASNFANNTEGAGAMTNLLNETARILGSVANDRVEVAFTPVSVANNAWSFTFTYTVL